MVVIDHPNTDLPESFLFFSFFVVLRSGNPTPKIKSLNKNPSNMPTHPFIKKIWILENKTTEIHKKTGILVGDGRFEIGFVTGGGYRTIRGNEIKYWGEGIFLGGQLDKSLDLEILPQTKIYFIKVEPWVMGLLSGFHFKGSLNETIPFGVLNPSLNRKLLAFDPHTHMDQILGLLSEAISEAMLRDKDWPLIQQCCLILDHGYIDFKQAKDHYLSKVHFSARSIEQKFSRYIGLSPQKYSRGMRFRNISEELKHGSIHTSLTALAHKHGYFDQAHLIREFKSYFGFTPRYFSDAPIFITNSQEDFRYYTI